MIAMRRFTLGSGLERKIVVIDVNGANLTVLRVKPDGTSKRQSQDFFDESAAKSAAEQLGRELLARGYVEQGASGRKPLKATAKAIHAAMAAPAPEMEEDDNGLPYDMMEGITEPPQPVLQRLALLPAATAAPAEAPPRKKT